MPVREIGRNLRCKSYSSFLRGTFNEKVVFMEYDDFDVYIDNSTKKKSDSSPSRSPSLKKDINGSDESEED